MLLTPGKASIEEFDTLPKKLENALVGGKTEGVTVDMANVELAKDWYYEMAGWDVNSGNPKNDTYNRLGLGWIMDL